MLRAGCPAEERREVAPPALRALAQRLDRRAARAAGGLGLDDVGHRASLMTGLNPSTGPAGIVPLHQPRRGRGGTDDGPGRRRAGAVASTLLLLCVIAATAHATFPGQDGRISFSRF